MLKVIALNGSPRTKGNSYQGIQVVFQVLQSEGIETELTQLGGKRLRGCRACYQCLEKKNQRCVFSDDDMNTFIAKMLEADGMIIASPVYFSNVTSEVKALIDRAGMVARSNEDMFKRKVGAAVVAMRRAGGTATFSAINYFFGISQMIVPGSNYWNLAVGRDPGDIQKDEEGLLTLKTLGENLAWLLKRIHGAD